MTVHRILLVDDHARLRELYRLALEGHPDLDVVAEAEDGEQGARLARDVRPDLVVLDLSMPRRDGLQAIQDIKAEVPEARIAVVSGFMRERVERLVMELGANAYIEKGIPMVEIPQALRDVAEQSPRPAGRRLGDDELRDRLRQLV